MTFGFFSSRYRYVRLHICDAAGTDSCMLRVHISELFRSTSTSSHALPPHSSVRSLRISPQSCTETRRDENRDRVVLRFAAPFSIHRGGSLFPSLPPAPVPFPPAAQGMQYFDRSASSFVPFLALSRIVPSELPCPWNNTHFRYNLPRFQADDKSSSAVITRVICTNYFPGPYHQ